MPRQELPHVHRYRDRHGVLRRYVRRKGHKAVPLNDKPGTPEYHAAYMAAFADAPQVLRRAGYMPGTIGDLWRQYQRTARWQNLSRSSQVTYGKVMDGLMPKIGHRSAAGMEREHVEAIVHDIGVKRPAMANLTLSVLRLLMRFAIERRMRRDNPASNIDRYEGGTHHTWTDAELAQFEAHWPLGTRERLAYALLLYTGQRGGDVVAMRRSDIVNGAIRVTQRKTGRELMIPIHPSLQAALDAYPARGLSLIGDAAGRPMKRHTLTEWLKRAIAAAGLPAQCLPHGLRKAVMRRLAERGADVKAIAAVSGHKTLREVQRYTDAADQVILSRRAMALLSVEVIE